MRIQVVSVPRSGSTYFYRMLTRYTYINECPWPVGWGEWLNPELIGRDTERQGISYAEAKSRRLSTARKLKNIVIKTQMAFLRDPETRDVCMDPQLDWYNIFFYRKNIFEMALSMEIAGKTGEFVYYDNTAELEVDVASFKNSLNYYRSEYNRIQNNEYGFEFQEVVAYEDLTFNEDTDFHNLKLSNRLSHKTKQAPEKTRVTNYDYLLEYAKDHLGDSLEWEFKNG